MQHSAPSLIIILALLGLLRLWRLDLFLGLLLIFLSTFFRLFHFAFLAGAALDVPGMSVYGARDGISGFEVDHYR